MRGYRHQWCDAGCALHPRASSVAPWIVQPLGSCVTPRLGV